MRLNGGSFFYNSIIKGYNSIFRKPAPLRLLQYWCCLVGSRFSEVLSSHSFNVLAVPSREQRRRSESFEHVHPFPWSHRCGFGHPISYNYFQGHPLHPQGGQQISHHFPFYCLQRHCSWPLLHLRCLEGRSSR